jgi:hypothetical protein
MACSHHEGWLKDCAVVLTTWSRHSPIPSCHTRLFHCRSPALGPMRTQQGRMLGSCLAARLMSWPAVGWTLQQPV